jgi:hypothetical protein
MRRLVVVAVAWFGAAIALGLSGQLGRAPFLVPMMTFGAIAAGVVAYARGGELRRVADDVDLRWPILVHAVRAPIGAFLLVEMSRDVLPALFANRAGPGDIAVGLLALVVAAVPTRRAIVAAWCVLGIADLALAFGTAQYLFFVVGDTRMTVVGHLPYTLLPAFIVPVMVLSHLLVLRRLRASSRDAVARPAPAR